MIRTGEGEYFRWIRSVSSLYRSIRSVDAEEVKEWMEDALVNGVFYFFLPCFAVI